MIKAEFNGVTQENIVRDFTPEELQEWNLVQEEALVKAAEREAKVAQRQALLAKLGITEEEAKLLLGGN